MLTFAQSRPQRVIRQYHLKTDTPNLPLFAQHFANRVWREVVDHIPPDAKTPDLYLAMRHAIEEELREHVIAMDLCGLSDVCRDSTEYDPWPLFDSKRDPHLSDA